MKQPPIQNDLKLLNKQTYDKSIVCFCVSIKYGLNIKPFETIRTIERQKYLYSIGRTINIGSKPSTRTMKSKHIEGKAIDRVFIDDPKNMRVGDRKKFWKIASQCGFEKIPQESCHTQDNGKTIETVMKENSALRLKTTDIKLKDYLADINKAFRSIGYK